MQKFDNALGSFIEAIKLNKNSDLYQKNLGNLYYSKGDYQNALKSYE